MTFCRGGLNVFAIDRMLAIADAVCANEACVGNVSQGR